MATLSKTFIVRTIVGILALGLLTFLGLIGYYTYVVKFGTSEQITSLKQQFSASQISTLPGSTIPKSQIVHDSVVSFIRPHNPTFGNENAAVTLVAFVDFECPFCRGAYKEFEQIRDEFGPAVQIVFKHFPISHIHPRATKAGIAAQCAHNEGKFWEYYKLLFEKQKLDDTSLLSYARELGLPATFDVCINNNKIQQLVDQDTQDGLRAGVRGTPTYLLNQTRVEGVTSLNTWRALIIDALQ